MTSLFVEDHSDNEDDNAIQLNKETIQSKDNDDSFDIPLFLKPPPPIEQTIAGTVNVQSTLSLKFQQMILEELLIDDALLILAKGLGMETIISNLLHVLATPSSLIKYGKEEGKRSLVILLSAFEEENTIIGEELMELAWSNGDESDDDDDVTVLKREFLCIKGESVGIKKRRQLYEQGGIISISSRVFIVDLLSGIVDADFITGLVILHAEQITETSNESFIINFYRSKNNWGFLKCVTDEPQGLINTAYQSNGGSILNPLQVMLRNMRLDKILLWPRFQIHVISSLNYRDDEKNKNKGKVIEIAINMTESMERIQLALLSASKALLYEIKRHNPEITNESELFTDLNRGDASNKVSTDIKVEDEYSRFLDDFYINQVMSLFNKNWHRISWTTKQLIGDLMLMKRLLTTLISDDCIGFYEEVEIIVNQHEKDQVGGRLNYNSNPWLMLDEASTIVSFAKKRVYDIIKENNQVDKKESYLLEEPPKWEQLAMLLHDIFSERINNNSNNNFGDKKLGTVLIMCSSSRTVEQLKDFLLSMRDEDSYNFHEQEFSGRKLMLKRYKEYIYWKTKGYKLVEKINQTIKENENSKKLEIEKLTNSEQINDEMDKEEEKESEDNLEISRTFNRNSQPVNKRRRTRGGSYVAQATELHTAKFSKEKINNGEIENEILNINDEIISVKSDDDDYQYDFFGINQKSDEELVKKIEKTFELISKYDQIVIEKYNKLMDHEILNELLPTEIIMYEPNLEFVRRIEIYQIENGSINLHTYLMYYKASVEEQRYLNRIKKEKESFTRLIKEKGQLGKVFEDEGDLKLLPLKGKKNKIIHGKKIKNYLKNHSNKSTRIAGGRILETTRINNKKIVVDMREFRSALPNILFRSGFEIIPCVITVGDYILSPKICIERKSVPDLIQSFEKGNLYYQCERMLKYYEIVILLIEFDENKSFSLNPFVEFKNKFDSTRSILKPSHSIEKSFQNIRLKLVMLLLKFPALKIIWSPSPYKTAEFFQELKSQEDDPDVSNAIRLGNDNILKNHDSLIQENDSSIELLKNIPGITSANYSIIADHVKNFQELVELEEFEISLLIGEENGKKVYRFLHRPIMLE